nr:MAG TPA_asm: hypothetical protein [Caudoviricetes sp.]
MITEGISNEKLIRNYHSIGKRLKQLWRIDL